MRTTSFVLQDRIGFKPFLLSLATSPDKLESIWLCQGELTLSEQTGTITIQDKTDLSRFGAERETDATFIPARLTAAALSGFQKNNSVYILAHTHPSVKGYTRQVRFSPSDLSFEKSACDIAELYGYKRPLVFLVANSCSVHAHLYYQGQRIDDIPFLDGDENLYHKRDLHIVSNDNFGVLYYVPKNKLCCMTPEKAKKFAQLQTDCENGTVAPEIKNALNQWIRKNFEDLPSVDFITPKKFTETGIISKLEILIQTGCNLNCKYCYADGGTYHRPQEHLTPEKAELLISTLLDQANVRQVNSVMLFGGEPAAYPETIRSICDLFQRLFEKGRLPKVPVFTMVTNGTLLSDLLLDTIKKYNIQLTISEDGPQQIHDQLRIDRAGQGTYHTVMKNIEKLKKNGVRPKLVEATYTKLHEQSGISPKDTADFIQSTINPLNVTVCMCEGENDYRIEADANSTYVSLQIQDFFHCFLYESQPNNSFPIWNTVISLLGALHAHQVSSLKCSSGANSICLLPDGSLYPCHRFLPDQSYCLATYKKGQWIFNNYDAAFSQILSLGKNMQSECRNCWARLICADCSAPYRNKFLAEHPEVCNRYLQIVNLILLCLVELSKEPIKFHRFHDLISMHIAGNVPFSET